MNEASRSTRRDAPRTRDPIRTRATLIAAAREAFVEHGFVGARTSQIATAAGVPQGLIYHYFKSKRALLDAVMHDALEPYFRATVDMLSSAEEANLELLEQAIRMYFRFLRDNPHVARLMAWWSADQGWEDGPPLGLDEELCGLPHELGAQRIREGQAAGFIKEELDPVMVIDSFLDLCMSWHVNFGRKCLDAEVDPSDDERAASLHDAGEDHIVSIILSGAATSEAMARYRPSSRSIPPTPRNSS